MVPRVDGGQIICGLFTGAVFIVFTPVLLSLLASSTANAATWKAESFSPELQHIVTRLVDVILPGSTTPGALDVNVPQFIDKVYGKLFSVTERQNFSAGADAFAGRFEQVFGHRVMDGGGDEFQQLLAGYFNLSEQERNRIFAEQDKNLADIAPADRDVYLIYRFLLSVRENTLFGYFTSEIGYTQAMRYAETPGRFEPCVPFTPGEKSWADHA